MDDDNQIIFGKMKPIGSGYSWEDETNEETVQKDKVKSNKVLVKALLAGAAFVLLINLFQSSSKPNISLTEAFPNKQELESKYSPKVITQISVVTRAEAMHDKKTTLAEIDRLMTLVKEDLTAKAKNNVDLEKDSLYQFCVKKRSFYK